MLNWHLPKKVRASRFLKRITNIRMRGGRAIRDDRNAELDSEYGRQARSTDTVTQKTFPTHSTSTLHAPEYCSSTISHDSYPASKRRSRELGGQASMHGTPSLSPTQHAQNGLRPVPSSQGAVRPRSRPHQTDGRPGLPDLESLQPITVAVHLSPNDKSDAVASRSPNRANRRRRRSSEAVQTRTVQHRSPQEGTLGDPSHLVNKPASPHASTSTNHSSTSPASQLSFTSMSAAATSSLHTPIQPPMTNEPPPSLNRVGSSRLSPSLVIRHIPMPILHLPTLPPPSPPAQPTRMHSQARLRSMPALPVEGPGDDDIEADHENSGLGDSDDEDDDSHPRNLGDDARQLSESYPSSHNSTRASSPQLSGGPPFLSAVLVDTSRLDLSFLDHPFGYSADMPRGRAGPVDSVLAKTDGRTSPSLSPTRTVRPSDVPRTHISTPFRPTEISVASTGLEHTSSRASMYRLPSRSMVMLSPKREVFSPDATSSYTIGQILDKGKGRESSEAASTTIKPPEPRSGEPPTKNVDALVVGSPLRRQRSLPTFNRSSEPPPYPSFPLHHLSTVMPREEEGREKLPPYSNDIYLAAIMPRKMEFSAPGVQARDRKWRRALCVLHGTVFKVYQCPRSVTGTGVLEDWWEKRVGVGDVSAPLSTAPVGTRASMDYSTTRSIKSDLAAHPDSSWAPRPEEPTHVYSTSDLLQPPSQSHSNQQQRSGTPDAEANQRTSSSSYCRQHASNSSSSYSVGSSGPLPTSTSPSTISSYSQTIDPSKIKPSKESLIRAYTMQHAESGLGNDYMKRKNVIRLRLEGEQFLLQAVDVFSVVEWIEVRG